MNCARCGNSGIALQVCSGCKQVSYCSKLCQKEDWKSHKGSCIIRLSDSTSVVQVQSHSEKYVNQKKNSTSGDKECANCGIQKAHLSMCSRFLCRALILWGWRACNEFLRMMLSIGLKRLHREDTLILSMKLAPCTMRAVV